MESEAQSTNNLIHWNYAFFIEYFAL